MKRKIHCRIVKMLGWLLAIALLPACDDLESIVLDSSGTTVDAGTGALYILCDGNYSLSNSTLALYNFTSSTLTTDFFLEKNGRKLGDTGNDLQRYGSKIYVVVNASSQVEVLDARTGISLKQIPFFDGETARQPRYIAFWEDKAYVCSFDGTVARIDTSDLEIEALTTAGRNPDGIAAANNKLYVSNSGGLDYASAAGYDNTVSIISTQSFTESKRLTVGTNPGRIRADNYGYVYVAVRGDYKTDSAKWQCIDTYTDQIAATYDLPVTNFDICGDYAYYYSYDQTTKESQIGVFNVKAKSVETTSFITDGTEITTPYGICADSESGAVFITDAGDYVSSGDLYCFTQQGTLAYKLTNVGVNPNTVLCVDDFAENGSVDTDSSEIENTYLYEVLDFTPAPGQFVGTYPPYVSSDNVETMRAKAEVLLKGTAGGIVSLGRYGGSLTFAFKTAVVNTADENDFKILGNAFTNSSEPGIVEVSADVNENGLPDDSWYELAGSDYANSTTTHGYQITYYRPANQEDSVPYCDNQGNAGYVTAYYPAWQADSIVCKGTLLAPTATQNATGYWTLGSLDWGYADNQPNKSELSEFDIDWAVDASGNKVSLTQIHFIRVYTGVNQNAGWTGELSTEVTGAEKLNQ
jgi:hypothetical protein